MDVVRIIRIKELWTRGRSWWLLCGWRWWLWVCWRWDEDVDAEAALLTLELVIIRVHHPQVLLRHSARWLVLVHTQDRLQHLHHLLAGLVPHSCACVDPRDVVWRFDYVLGRSVWSRVARDALIVVVVLIADVSQFLGQSGDIQVCAA